MSEPSSGVPSEISDAKVEEPQTEQPERVELDVDEDKLEAWDDIKSDYQVDPDGKPVPNSMDAPTPAQEERIKQGAAELSEQEEAQEAAEEGDG